MTDRAHLMRVALGEAPADLLVTGATVLDVYTEEWLRSDVAVAGERVAAVGPDLSALAGPATLRLEATGRILVPGLIDGHTHADSLVTIPELLREAIPRGLTTLITEKGQPTAALGAADARWFCDLLEAPEVLGLGEVYWHRLLPEPKRLLPLMDRARALRKTVEGHSAGARAAKLTSPSRSRRRSPSCAWA